MEPLNFRDVGESVSILMDEPCPLPPGVLFRGGKLDWLHKRDDLGGAGTIVNLRRGEDPDHLDGVRWIHVPAPNTVENYETWRPEVRAWIQRAIAAIVDPENPLPIYVHCTSGKDRTGVVIAALLSIMGVPRQIIVEEYLLSAEVSALHIEAALDGLAGCALPARATVEQALRRTAGPTSPPSARS